MIPSRMLPLAAVLGAVGLLSASAFADEDEKKQPEYPPHAKVLDGYEKVASSDPAGKGPFYTLYVDKKKGHVLAELPRDYESMDTFMGMTLASGDVFAGLQSGDLLVKWKKYGKTLALRQPNLSRRPSGDKQIAASVNNIYTDTVLVAVPIVTMGPGGGPVIDMNNLLINNASTFFGGRAGRIDPRLRTIVEIETAKAFEKNVEIAFELPMAGGQLKTLHYSISKLEGSSGYKPREADDRVGYFTTAYLDLGKFGGEDAWTRYVTRWNLKKAKPELTLSPPEQPITFYIENTTPIQYRRFVREGVLYWNRAFEAIGIDNAIVVIQQDENSPETMKLSPEDVNYNFVRWLANDISTAIGPSRVNPKTGEILDADIVLTDGWIRYFNRDFNDVLPDLAMEGMTHETRQWLAQRPEWDPRVRLASPENRSRVLAQIAAERAVAVDRATGTVGAVQFGDAGSVPNHPCQCQSDTMQIGKTFDLAMLQVSQELILNRLYDDEDGDKKDEEKKKKDEEKSEEGTKADQTADVKVDEGKTEDDKDKKTDDEVHGDPKGDADKDKEDKKPKNLIDGMPAEFIGPLLRDLVAHEVGHTLGLRHNFKASSLYLLSEMNSDKVKGQKALTASVMDYSPTNINMEKDRIQGDYANIMVGPYDMWAIKYGYSFDEKKLPEMLKEAADNPALAYATDEDTAGPDPLARRYDFSANPLEYAKSQIELAEWHRKRLIENFVKDGESWARARKGYDMTLTMQTRAVSMMANWIGGVHVYRDHKGDAGERKPLDVVPAKTQRDAVSFITQSTFQDEAFGLTPELLQYMTVEKWSDEGGRSGLRTDSTYPVHDRVIGLQTAAMTMLMNPTTLRRVFDNEYRVPGDQDAYTLAEMLDQLSSSIWSELDAMPEEGEFSTRKPMISSLRRNLQSEHVERLIDLAMPKSYEPTSALKPIRDLAALHLRQLLAEIGEAAKKDMLDPYSKAHLAAMQSKVAKALDAQYIYNADDIGGGGGGGFIIFGEEAGANGRHVPTQTPFRGR